jgi:anaerobic selenocysteine-containing dehydrogenase
MCLSECGVLAHVKNGFITKIEGDPSDPLTKGVMCPKGLAAKQLLYHTDRLKYPLMRAGERGEGKWKRISWDDALDIISSRLKEIKQKYGAEAVAFAQGTSRGWFGVFVRFVNAFSSPNWGEPGMAQCMYPRVNAGAITFGHMGSTALRCPDYEHTKCIVIWGENPFATRPDGIHTRRIVEATERGAKLIVVDPRFTETASKADIWLQVRPGTDAALALGMLNVIVNEGLYDKTFVNKWTVGFEKLVERVKEASPTKVAEITWVPEEEIIQAAKTYAFNKPACALVGVSTDQMIESIQNARAISILIAITGNVDVKGGNLFKMSAGQIDDFSREFVLENILPDKQRKKRLGVEKYPFLCGSLCIPPPGAHMPTVWQAILTGEPYPIKAMVIHGSNAVISYANSKEVMKALRKLEFLSVADIFHNQTTELADILLPAATWLERSELVSRFHATYSHLLFRQKVIEPLWECWSDVKILSELAKRLGFGQYFWDDENKYLDYLLMPTGITFEELKRRGMIEVPMKYRKYEEKGFETPSKKVEIYSSTLEKAGYDPLPFYREPPESPFKTPELAKDYPLILTTGGRTPVYFHNEFRQLPWLKEIIPEPLLEINTKTAEKLGVRDGDVVSVESPRGDIKVKVKATEGIHPKVVEIAPWPGEANVNILTDNKECAQGMGSTPLRGLLCRVRKV